MNCTKEELHIIHCNLAEAVVSNKELTIRIYPREVMTLEELEANAYLIAASPRMMKLIEKTILQNGYMYQEDVDEAKAIQAKAEGRKKK